MVIRGEGLRLSPPIPEAVLLRPAPWKLVNSAVKTQRRAESAAEAVVAAAAEVVVSLRRNGRNLLTSAH